MENLALVLSEITRLTTTLETEYPELYRFLDENPMTLPTGDETSLNLETMQNYLQSLKQLLKTYSKAHNT